MGPPAALLTDPSSAESEDREEDAVTEAAPVVSLPPVDAQIGTAVELASDEQKVSVTTEDTPALDPLEPHVVSSLSSPRGARPFANDYPTPATPFDPLPPVDSDSTGMTPVAFSPLLALEPGRTRAPEAGDSSAVDAGWSSTDASGEDLTRQLLTVVPARIESAVSDVELTSPLPPPAAAPAPYGSDAELTVPLIAAADEPDIRPVDGLAFAPARRPVPSIPPLRPVPTLRAPVNDDRVAVVVAFPPPSVGAIEHPPSVQISGSERPRSSALETLPGLQQTAAGPSEFATRPMRSSMAPVTGSVPPPARLPASWRWIAVAAATLGVGTLAFALHHRTGTAVVTAIGADGAPIRGASIRVDGTDRCTGSPCRLDDLSVGTHLIRVTAAGFSPSAERAITVEANGSTPTQVALSTDPSTERSGLAIAAIGEGLHVIVDGRDLGAPPVSVADVQPGSHVVRVTGALGLYEPYEETVRLNGGEVRNLGPVRLRLLKGRLVLSGGEGSDGAKIAVDGHRVAQLPATLDLSPDESHEVTASKPGFTDLNEQVVFDGTAERSVTVALEPAHGATPAHRAPAVAVNTPPRPSSATTRKATAVAAPASTAASGVATLDINSSPRANVVLNGRPLGSTPLKGVRVTPGAQTILFINPKLGRKMASANVGAGKHGSAFVKF